MTESYLFDVFGKRMSVHRENGMWRLFLVSGTGMRRPVYDVFIPAVLEPEELATYLDDIFHEHASASHPKVYLL